MSLRRLQRLQHLQDFLSHVKIYSAYSACSAYGAYGPSTLASIQFNLQSDLFRYQVKIMFIHNKARPTPIAKPGGAGGDAAPLLNIDKMFLGLSGLGLGLGLGVGVWAWPGL